MEVARSASSGSGLPPILEQGASGGFLQKHRKLIALGVFMLTLARAIGMYVGQQRLKRELLRAHDHSQDQLLTVAEMANLLSANAGVNITQEQVLKIFGSVNAENRYDVDEMAEVVFAFSELKTALEPVRLAGRSKKRYMALDVSLFTSLGLVLAFLIFYGDAMQRKWAGSAFRNAYLLNKWQRGCDKLATKLDKLEAERQDLERSIAQLEREGDKAPRAEMEARREHLKDVIRRQTVAQAEMQQMAEQYRSAAERYMQEATRAQNTMRSMLQCMRGLDAFVGKGGQKFQASGAMQGFSSKVSKGFLSRTILFGTIENGKPVIYETSTSKSSLLGTGTDCAYRCTEISTGRESAVKMYQIKDEKKRSSILNDLQAHRKKVGSHPRIVSYQRVIESEDTIFVVMELLQGMDLFDLVVASKGLKETEARPLFKELVEALQHIHGKGIIHCDVKTENAFIQIDNGESHLKLIDFGIASFGRDAPASQDMYVPPEHAEDNDRPAAVPTDMWRLGCTLYCMLVAQPPFTIRDAFTPEGVQQRRAAKYTRSCERFVDLSDEAKDLIARLIVGDERQRLDTAQVLAHPWMMSAALSAGGA